MAATLQTFGGGTSDLIFDPSNGGALAPNAPFTVIDAVTLLPATGLLDASGVAVTQLVSDADGRYAGSAMLEGVAYYLQTTGARGKTYTWGPMVSTKAVADTLALAPQLDSIAASAAASAFAAKQAQAAAEAVQTGSATTNASLLTSGTVAAARLPDLSGTYASASALSAVTTTAGTAKSTADSALSTANATQTQQTQLMAVTPTVDELVQSVHITNSQTNTQTQTGTNSRVIWIAPFPCKVVALTLAFQTYTQAVDAANYWEIALRRIRGAANDFIVGKKTNAEAIAPLVPWRYSGATWNAANQVFAEGDLLSFNMILTGAPTPVAYPLTATFRYVPL